MNSVEAPIRRIVVGVDGSEPSIEALRQAQRLAQPLGAEVIATAFWDFPQLYAGYVPMSIEDFEKSAGSILNESIEKAFGTETPGNVVPRLLRGRPRESLIEESLDADLVVVGRRGHGGFKSMLLGSVSSACVAHAHCPVLVVHSPDNPPRKDLP